MSGRDIADRLSVDARTVRRYILMLEDLGIPIVANRGKIGGYRLMPGYKLPPLMFSESEVLAVLLGLSAAKQIGLSITHDADIESAKAKITRVLPDGLRRRVTALESSLSWDWTKPETRNHEVSTETMLTLGDCVRRSTQSLVKYCRSDGTTTERLIDPYGLVCRNRRWYVIGYCHLRIDVRLFRIDRIISINAQNAFFVRPKDFDVLAELTTTLGSIERALKLDVLLATTLEHAQRHISAEVAILEDAGSGNVRLRGYTDCPEFIATLLAGIGCNFEINSPPELRSAMSDLACKLVECATR
jgi:predicted DNA-binding transcriptional regulator YafY